jgi:hypothetical protein
MRRCKNAKVQGNASKTDVNGNKCEGEVGPLGLFIFSPFIFRRFSVSRFSEVVFTASIYSRGSGLEALQGSPKDTSSTC